MSQGLQHEDVFARLGYGEVSLEQPGQLTIKVGKRSLAAERLASVIEAPDAKPVQEERGERQRQRQAERQRKEGEGRRGGSRGTNVPCI